MKSIRITITIIILAILLNACAASNSVAAVNLESETWALTNLNGNDPLDSHRPTLQFEVGQVSGNASCNHYGGCYFNARSW